MALITYKCPKCQVIRQFLKVSKFVPICPEDETILERIRSPATSKVVEVVDNGLQARRVEVVKKG